MKTSLQRTLTVKTALCEDGAVRGVSRRAQGWRGCACAQKSGSPSMRACLPVCLPGRVLGVSMNLV